MEMNFGSLLNSFRFLLNSEVIENLLNKEDLTIEELLDNDEDALMEIKKGNPKLLEFLIPDQLYKLIDYIILEPKDLTNPNTCYKYPFVSNEIINSESHELLNAFFSDLKLMEHLFQFLDTDVRLNLTLAGYFSRTLNSLLVKNSYELLSFLYDSKEYGKALAKHLYSKSICDVLEKILSCEYHNNPAFKSELFEVIDLILENISVENPPESVINSCNLLVNLINKISDNSTGFEIADYLSGDEKNVKILFGRLYDTENHVSRGAGTVLQAVINCILIKSNDEEEQIRTDEVLPLVDFVIQNFEKFVEALERSPNKRLKSSNKIDFVPLGETRLKIIEILYTLIKMNNFELNTKVAESEVLKIITDLFVEYPWNSLLHCAYEKLVQSVIFSGFSALKDAVRII